MKEKDLIRTLIEPLLGSFDDQGRPYTAEELHNAVQSAIANASAPEKALLNINRMAESSFGISFIRDLIRYPVLMDLAVKIACRSQYLSDIIVRDPELFRWLTTTEVLSITKTRDDYIGDLKKQAGLFEKRESQLNAIRRAYRREILRIGVRDILQQDSFEVIVKEISDFADAIASVVLDIAMEETTQKYKGSPQAHVVIIGLGKLGGSELNYSSDVDVMFVVDEDTIFTTQEGREVLAVDFFSSVADRWIAYMTEYSKEGSLYRVDARLRPDGDAGPLVRSFQGCITYYETRGELWERQMLIKARPIAGNIEKGDYFIKTLQPFIYPATFFHSPHKTIARMKERIEGRLDGPNNIKLCRGGIRDIEFIVQALQLVNGGKNIHVRNASTLKAIELLFEQELLSRQERDTLRNAYIFFRNIEHQVQLDENIQTHSIPEEVGERTQFARLLGYQSVNDFDGELEAKRMEVVTIFNGVFGDHAQEEESETVITDDRYGDLKGFGFTNEKSAQELLNQLAFGITSVGIGEHDVQTKEIFRGIAPSLLDSFSATVNPDRALSNFLAIAREYPHPRSLYVMLQNDALRNALISLCGFSNKFSFQLAKYPGDIELLFSNAREILEVGDILDSGINNLTYRFLNLVIHLRYINGVCTLDEVHRTLSHIAVTKVKIALQEICRKNRIENPPIAIMSLGKLSGDELGPGADLDLIIFFEVREGFDAALAEKVARELIQSCASSSEGTIPFEVDMRLRPEGESAPLGVDVDSYREYLEQRASFWERQSLVRAKMIAGESGLIDRLENTIDNYVYNQPLPSGWAEEIEKMRYRTESRSRMNRQDYINFKTGVGGIMDIEFLVQALQLYYGNKDKSFRSTSTRKLLPKLHHLHVIGTEDAEFLSQAYEDFRRLEYFNRIYMEEPSNLVPSGVGEQEVLKKMLQIPEEPITYFRERVAAVRKLFIKIMEEVKTFEM